MLAQPALNKVIETLDERLGLDALWLFGSQAAGRAHAQSDIDLAALFARRPSASALFDVACELAAQLGTDIDLIDLEGASPILAMQVLRTGILLTGNASRHRTQFVAAAPGRYEDLRRVRAPIEIALRERLVHG